MFPLIILCTLQLLDVLCEVGQLDEVKRFCDDIIWLSKIHDDYVYAAILRGLYCSGSWMSPAISYMNW